MSIYDDFRDLAVDLLVNEFGVPSTLTSIALSYDAANDTVGASGTSVPCFAVIAPRRIVAESGRIIVETVARLNVKPAIGDSLTVGSATYKIQTVEEVAPDGDTPIIYMAQVSK